MIVFTSKIICINIISYQANQCVDVLHSIFADQIPPLPSRMLSPSKNILLSAQFTLNWAFFYSVQLVGIPSFIAAVAVANGVAVNAPLQLHVYYVLIHTVWYFSVLAAYILAAQNAQDNDADTDNLPHSPVLSSAWSVHFLNVKVQADSRFCLQVPSPC